MCNSISPQRQIEGACTLHIANMEPFAIGTFFPYNGRVMLFLMLPNYMGVFFCLGGKALGGLPLPLGALEITAGV